MIALSLRFYVTPCCCLSIHRHYCPSSVLNRPAHVPTQSHGEKLFIGSETLSSLKKPLQINLHKKPARLKCFLAQVLSCTSSIRLHSAQACIQGTCNKLNSRKNLAQVSCTIPAIELLLQVDSHVCSNGVQPKLH